MKLVKCLELKDLHQTIRIWKMKQYGKALEMIQQ